MKILVSILTRYSQRHPPSVQASHILCELEILDVHPQSGVAGRMPQPLGNYYDAEVDVIVEVPFKEL